MAGSWTYSDLLGGLGVNKLAHQIISWYLKCTADASAGTVPDKTLDGSMFVQSIDVIFKSPAPTYVNVEITTLDGISVVQELDITASKRIYVNSDVLSGGMIVKTSNDTNSAKWELKINGY